MLCKPEHLALLVFLINGATTDKWFDEELDGDSISSSSILSHQNDGESECTFEKRRVVCPSSGEDILLEQSHGVNAQIYKFKREIERMKSNELRRHAAEQPHEK